MAQIEKLANGSYRIRVFCGYSAGGKKQIAQSWTWKPPKDNMTEKQLDKALKAAAPELAPESREILDLYWDLTPEQQECIKITMQSCLAVNAAAALEKRKMLAACNDISLNGLTKSNDQ